MRRGSSPLARGLRTRNSRKALSLGIIPARAGFTLLELGVLWASWDHPRSRGVYLKTTDDAQPDAGSSPLARGLRRALNHRLANHGIIPARAGFTA